MHEKPDLNRVDALALADACSVVVDAGGLGAWGAGLSADGVLVAAVGAARIRVWPTWGAGAAEARLASLGIRGFGCRRQPGVHAGRRRAGGTAIASAARSSGRWAAQTHPAMLVGVEGAVLRGGRVT